MPASPRLASKLTCSICGWNTVTKPQSDVLFQSIKCGKCGNDKLSYSQAGIIENLLFDSVSFVQNIKNNISRM